MGISTSAYQNVSSWGNSSFDGFIQLANASGGGWLFTMIDFLVFVVLFITLTTQFGWESAIMSSGFIAMILTILFVYMGVMNMTIAGIFVGGLVAIIIYIMWSNKWD